MVSMGCYPSRMILVSLETVEIRFRRMRCVYHTRTAEGWQGKPYHTVIQRDAGVVSSIFLHYPVNLI